MFAVPSFFGYNFAKDAFVGLLDLYPNAAAAYSVRKLSSTYTGSAIRVRRTDLAESDIGFTAAGNLDTTALLAFTGTGALDNGFITTWYDQSGNARNATQTTAINQPQIVSSGSVLTTNSKPTLKFDGSNDGFTMGNQTVGVSTMIAVVQRNGTSGGTYHPIFTGTGGSKFFQNYIPNSTNVSNLFYGSNLNTGQSFDTSLQCFQSYFDSTVEQYKNNVIGSTASATITNESTGTFQLGRYLVNYVNGNYSEFIWYDTNQILNQNDIYTNINDYYSF
jgi:hypothetical protein